MATSPRRRRWQWATGAAVAALGLGACGGGHTAVTPAAAATPTRLASSAALTTLPAQTLRAQAVAATAALRSYAFSSEQFLTGTPGTPASTIVGRAILPDTVQYTLTLGGRQEEVVRLPGATYLRTLPGSWHRLTRTVAPHNPLASLLGVLRGMTQLVALPAGSGATLVGRLPWSAARGAGLVTAAAGPALPVTVDLDASHRVTEFKLTLPVSLRGRLLQAVQFTRFGAFNAVAAIRAP